MTTRRLVLLAALLVLLSACAGADGAAQRATDGGEAAADHEVAEPEPADEAAREEEAAADGRDVAADDADTGIVAGEADRPLPPLAEQASVGSGERLIKEGTMTIEVDEGSFLEAYQRVIAAARELGGFVSASTTTSTDDGGTRGSVTVRVPVDRYEDLLTRVGGIGELRRQDVTSKDVTGEFTDLRSRLRHLRAQEAFYLELLEDAESVQDAIAVKQHLDGIQSRIEQARGRLNVLEDRTSYSTLTVEIVEPGAGPAAALAGTRPMLADYWETARDGFVRVVGWILVSSVSLAPVLLPVVLALLLWRVVRRRGAAPATVPADAE